MFRNVLTTDLNERMCLITTFEATPLWTKHGLRLPLLDMLTPQTREDML